MRALAPDVIVTSTVQPEGNARSLPKSRVSSFADCNHGHGHTVCVCSFDFLVVSKVGGERGVKNILEIH